MTYFFKTVLLIPLLYGRSRYISLLALAIPNISLFLGNTLVLVYGRSLTPGLRKADRLSKTGLLYGRTNIA